MKNILFLLLLSASLTIKAAGYKIDLTINGLHNNTVYLGNYYGNSYLITDTVKLNTGGQGTFSDNKKLPHGLYMVLLPGGSYFDIIIGKEQVFSITTDTIDYIGHMQISGSKENRNFIAYQQYMMKQEKKKKHFREKLVAAENDSVTSKNIRKKLAALEQETQTYRQILTDTCQGTFLSDYLNATKSPRLPGSLSENTRLDMQNIQKLYQYKKEHYFDHIDLTDSRFLRTPLLHRKIDQYFNQMLIQETDTLIKAIDQIATLTRANDEIYKYVLTYLFNNYHLREGQKYQDVYVYLIEQYYLPGKAPWITSEMKDKLQGQVERLRNTKQRGGR